MVKSNDPESQEKYAEHLLVKYDKESFVYKFSALDQLHTSHCQGEDLRS